MGKVENGINGAITGTVGPSVFYKMYGKNYVRALPDEKKVKVKATPARLRQQQRLSLVTAFLKPFKDLVKITFASVTKGRAPYHTAQSLNMKNCIIGDTYPDQEIDYSKTLLSAGNLELPKQCSVKRKGTGLLFEWDDFDDIGTDTLVVAYLDHTQSWSKYHFTGIAKYENSFYWEAHINEEPIRVWMAFRSHNQQDMSNSVYLGKV